MLFELADYLSQHFSGFNVFQYLTMRAILGALTALLISLFLGPLMIRKLSHHQVGQFVRDDGPESHLSKAGTPTMGGALILAAIVLSTLLWADLSNRFIWIVLGVTVAFGAIGWVDDYRKLIKKQSLGLRAKEKYFWQTVAGLGGAFALYYTHQVPAELELILRIANSGI